MNSIQLIQKNSIAIASVLINLLIIMWVDATSVFSFFYTICIFFLVNHFMVKEPDLKRTNAWVMQLYVFLAILLYLVQKANIPDFFGMSGPSGEIGTDDYRYMAMISDNPALISLYPTDTMHDFAYFLNVLYPFPVRWPLNIVIPNLLGMVFLPYLTYQLANSLFQNQSVSKKAYSLTIWCPFLLFGGLILMRDTWVATFYISGMICFLRRKYIALLIVSAILFYLRSGSFVLLVLAIIVYSRHLLSFKFSKETSLKVYLLLLLGFLAVFIVLYQFLPLVFERQFTGSVTRDDFVESYLSQYEDTLLYTISMWPIYLRIPAVTLFFLFTPFFNIIIYTLGVFNLRMILMVMVFPLYFAYHSSAFFRSMMEGLRKPFNPLADTVWLIIISCTVLGLFSLQLRHKIPLMPLYYIVIAYGYCQAKQPLYKTLGVVFAVLFLTGQLVRVLFF